jgi:hypothetical protein
VFELISIGPKKLKLRVKDEYRAMIEIDVKSSLRGASVAGNYPVICALIMEFLDDLESNCIYHEQSTNIRIEITTSWSKFALLSQIPDSRIKVRTHSFNYRRIGVL